MKTFGHYQVISELGRGGMGVVLKAHEQSLNRYVAIKVLSQQLADDPAVRERFIREARAVAALNHPNVVQVYYAGEHEGQPFFSMEFVQGQSLSEYLRQHAPLSPKEAAEILLQACQGLAAAHDKGIVHRDIKPANLMMTADGTIKLTDFGIAMAEDQGRKLTSTGEFVGTPGYLSPEVCIGADVDARTDIFSLGIVYYEMLAGTPPFTNPSPLGLLREVVEARIPDISTINTEVDDTTRSLLEGMLEKKPEDRFGDCRAIITRLQEGLERGVFSDKRPLPNQDATRIWPQPTEAAESVPPQSPAAPSPPPAAAPAQTVAAKDVAFTRTSNTQSVRRWWMPALLLVALLAAGMVMARFLPQWLPEPLATLARVVGLLPDEKSSGNVSAAPSRRDVAQEQTFPAPAIPGEDDAVPGEQAMAEPFGTEGPSGVVSGVEPMQDTTRVEPIPLPPDDDTPAMAARVEEIVAAPQDRMPVSSRAAVPATGRTSIAKADARQAQGKARLEQARQASLERLHQGQGRAVLLLAGEPAVVDALRKPLASMLQNHGVRLLDRSVLGGAGPWLRQDHWDLAALQPRALEAGVDLLLLVRSRYQGQEMLEYYGQRSELISSQVDIQLVRVADLQTLVPPESFQVRYTHLNSQYQVREALADVADELDRQLRSALSRSG